VPIKATVKSSVDGQFVQRTIDRKTLWEIHTPQIIRPEVQQRSGLAGRDSGGLTALRRGGAHVICGQ
jgi:hypothetical protein